MNYERLEEPHEAEDEEEEEEEQPSPPLTPLPPPFKTSTCSAVAKVVFLSVYLVTGAFSNSAVLSYSHDIAGREPLPDLIFRLVGEQEWAVWAGENFVTICFLCLTLLLLLHRHRLTICRRLVFIAGTLYLMRCVTLLGTQLPPGYSNNTLRCRPRTNFSWTFLDRWVEQVVHLGRITSSHGMLCGDMLFSGHTLIMMLCCLTIGHYLPKKYQLLVIFPYLGAFCGMGCLIISRTHYTVDVVIAFWLTNLVFYVSHVCGDGREHGSETICLPFYSIFPHRRLARGQYDARKVVVGYGGHRLSPWTLGEKGRPLPHSLDLLLTLLVNSHYWSTHSTLPYAFPNSIPISIRSINLKIH